MYKLKKADERLRESLIENFNRDPEAFLDRIRHQQTAVSVMCGDSWIGRHHACQPGTAYVDDRVGGLPYSKHAIGQATAILIMMAEIAGLDTNNLSQPPGVFGANMSEGYADEADEMARDILREMLDEIVDDTLERGEVTDDPFDDIVGLDRRFYETAEQQCYGLADAAQVIDQLSDHEETDSGMWEGQEPEEAISTKAAFTFRNAVQHYVDAAFETLKADDEISDIVEKHEALQDRYEDRNLDYNYNIEGDAIKGRLKARIEAILED